jgi:acyl-CoA thioester hydrolase
MNSFEKRITVNTDDLDHLQHVNNVRYVQWIQDVAKAHWKSKVSKEMNDDYFWVVIEHHIQYKSSAILGDIIRIKTYVTETRGVTSTRVVEMYNDKDHKLIVKSETKWCLMNAITGRPARITEEITALFE